MVWQIYDAKARFSEFLETALAEGPQILTRRGVETAVLVPIEEWKRLNAASNPLHSGAEEPFIDPLTDPNGPHDLYIPPRRLLRRRPALVLED